MSTENRQRPTIMSFDPQRVGQSESDAMRSVLAEVRTVAPTRASVLLTGETGVGKGVFARLIHHWSNRSEMPFLALHCGAIPDTLLESELFGHEKGSFTGAHRRKQGQFELADRGTLFLDEIGTITHSAQIKLLDVLQGQRFHRVGGEEDVAVDVRIIAASNLDLKAMMERGAFRADLFHRLSVFPVVIPPLRERKQDLPALVVQLLERLNRLYAKTIDGLDPAVEDAFRNYAWPGNIRELENVLERAHILEPSRRISTQRIPVEILQTKRRQVVDPVHVEENQTLAQARSVAIAAAERAYLERLLAAHEGRIDASAREAGVTTRQLSKLLARHEIDKAGFKPHRPSRQPSSPAPISGEIEP